VSNPLNHRGDSMFLRLNGREASMLNTLASGGAIGNGARTLKRLQGLGLVNPDLRRHPADPVTPDGLAWLKDNPTAPGR
jgi:hypothetical protein